MSLPTIALKIDVDTEIGTRVGVPNLITLLKKEKIPATFYLSLGPDNTGRAIQRVLRKGFLKKCSRTSIIKIYGIRTLLNGILWPGPHIGKKHEKLLRSIKEEGFEVGIHAFDHQKWQDNVMQMSFAEIKLEFQKAQAEFKRIFGVAATTAAAPGWQANEKTLAVYDEADLLYASDCRGSFPFFPKIKANIYKTLQIPTTLPTLDELLGRQEFPLTSLNDYYLSLLKNDLINVFNIHPELEGMRYLDWFNSFLIESKKWGVKFQFLSEVALNKNFLISEVNLQEIAGRAGTLLQQQLTTAK